MAETIPAAEEDRICGPSHGLDLAPDCVDVPAHAGESRPRQDPGVIQEHVAD